MPFLPLLQELCQNHSVVRGVIFCDEEGERIERHRMDDNFSAFDLDVAGASFATLIPALESCRREGTIRIVFDKDAYWVQMLVEGYFLLVVARVGNGRDHALQNDLKKLGKAVIAHM